MSLDSTAALRDALRQLMPVTERYAYLDHAAVAPLPRPAAEAITRWLTQATQQGDVVWPDWAAAIEQTRASAAKLISAQPEEVALVPSTTHGITLVAEGLDWRSGDNVVTLADEFPSNLYPWMHQQDRGVEVRLVDTDNGRVNLDSLRDAVDARTRVVSVSGVGYKTGYRQPIDDIAEIAHAQDALFFVDAIQGMGVAPLDVTQTPIDCLAADGHKWMLGPEGAGVAYFRSGWLDRLRPLGVGWNSVVGRHDFNQIDLKLRPEAARYEGGSANMVGMIGLGASLKLLTDRPTEEFRQAILATSDYACDQLASIGARVVSHRAAEANGHDPRTGIVAFELPDRDPMEARRRCLEERVVLSCRGGRLRIAIHAYNNQSDIDRLVSALGSAAA